MVSIEEFESVLTACKNIDELNGYYAGYKAALLDYAVMGGEGKLLVGSGYYSHAQIQGALDMAYESSKTWMEGG